MDIYLSSLVLGGAGLAIMALGGIGRHGHDAAHAGGHHGHDAGGHHLGGHHAHHGGGHHGHHALGDHGHAAHGGSWAHSALWAVASPRVAFSALLGFGAAGLLAREALGAALAAALGAPVGGVVLFVIAVAGGVAFERLVVSPVWNFLLRFASAPARTLESTLLDEARAASGFDTNGEGLVAVEVDGQVVQVLGRLRAEDHALGLRVRAGDRLRVEDVDAERHRCTVSYLGR